jgi:hypothetical protein
MLGAGFIITTVDYKAKPPSRQEKKLLFPNADKYRSGFHYLVEK